MVITGTQIPRGPNRPLPPIPAPATQAGGGAGPAGPCGGGLWFTLGFPSKQACKQAGGVPTPPPNPNPAPPQIFVCSDGSQVTDPSKCPTIQPPPAPGQFDLCKILPALCSAFGGGPGIGSGATTGSQPGTCPPGSTQISGPGGLPACIPLTQELGPPTTGGGTTDKSGFDPTQLFGSMIQSLLSGQSTAGGGTGSAAPPSSPSVTVIPPAQSTGGGVSSPLFILAALIAIAGGGLWIYKHRHKLFKEKE